MKVLIIGGTGLLGLAGAKELIKRNHKVKTIALPVIPEGVTLPEELEIILGDYEKMSDEELKKHLEGQDALVFAAGVDERIEGKPPIIDFYYQRNVYPLKRLLKLTKEMKLTKAVICGSYFTYLDRNWENLYLYETHPYIKSRVDQTNEAFHFGDKSFAVSVLELPYIFGTQPGRKPVWVFLVEQIKKMKPFTFYPRGGTAMLTVNQVGQVIASALEKASGVKNIPVGYYNLTWRQMIKIFHKHMGTPNKRIISIPKWLYKIVLSKYKRVYRKKGIESGLDFRGLAEIMTRKAYIDNSYIKNILKVQEDDLDKAIGESVMLSLEILENNKTVVDMK